MPYGNPNITLAIGTSILPTPSDLPPSQSGPPPSFDSVILGNATTASAPGYVTFSGNPNISPTPYVSNTNAIFQNTTGGVDPATQFNSYALSPIRDVGFHTTSQWNDNASGTTWQFTSSINSVGTRQALAMGAIAFGQHVWAYNPLAYTTIAGGVAFAIEADAGIVGGPISGSGNALLCASQKGYGTTLSSQIQVADGARTTLPVNAVPAPTTVIVGANQTLSTTPINLTVQSVGGANVAGGTCTIAGVGSTVTYTGVNSATSQLTGCTIPSGTATPTQGGSVTFIGLAIPSGTFIRVQNSGAIGQQWTLSANANVGDTTLNVNSLTPNDTYPIGSEVSASQNTGDAIRISAQPNSNFLHGVAIRGSAGQPLDLNSNAFFTDPNVTGLNGVNIQGTWGNAAFSAPGTYINGGLIISGTIRGSGTTVAAIVLSGTVTNGPGIDMTGLTSNNSLGIKMGAHNISFDTVTGGQIGVASTNKIGFWGATPVVRPSTVGTSTGYTAGATVATFHSDDTYTGTLGATGYTINGIVTCLKQIGLLVQ